MVSGLAAAVSLPASNWIGRAPEALPKLQQKLGPLQGPIQYVQEGVRKLEHLMEPPAGQQGGQQQGQTVTVKQSSGLGGLGLSVLNGTRAFLGKFFTVVVILFFLLWAGDTLLRSFVEIMPRFRDKRRVVEISGEIEGNISGYLATITMMNALVGIANGLSTWACGLPDPLLWGTLAFLLNYIPILGPFTGVVVFFVVGLFVYSTHLVGLPARRHLSADPRDRGRDGDADAAGAPVHPEPGAGHHLAVRVGLDVGRGRRAARGAAAGDLQDRLRPHPASDAARPHDRRRPQGWRLPAST